MPRTGIINRTIGRMLRLGTRARVRRTVVIVAADVDSTLMVSARALRRLGARITRYDTDASLLEARIETGHVSVQASVDGDDVTRLAISTDAPGAGRLLRRFAEELAAR